MTFKRQSPELLISAWLWLVEGMEGRCAGCY